MIIFYNILSGDIVGVIEGRVHSEHVMKNILIKPGEMPEEDVAKYIVPTKARTETKMEDVTELRVVDRTTGRVEQVKVGEKAVESVVEMVPDGAIADFVLKVERGEAKITDYKIIIAEDVRAYRESLDKDGNAREEGNVDIFETKNFTVQGVTHK